MSRYRYNEDEKDIIVFIAKWMLVGAVIALFLGFVGNATGLFNMMFWQPKVEQARYNVFKESQAYNESTLRDLYDYKRDFDRQPHDKQLALRGAILHQFSVYDRTRLPAELQLFYSQVETMQ